MRNHEEKIPYEPHGDPTTVTDDGYEVYRYETDGIVPDIIVWHVEGDERADLYGFVGHEGLLVHTTRAIHRHPPDYEEPNCEKWTVFGDDSFPPMEEAPATPERVRELATTYSDAPLLDKARHPGGDDDG